MNDRDLRQEIVRTCRRMSTSGLGAGTEGNGTARTPGGGVLVTPSGLDCSVVAPEDGTLVVLDGETIEGVFGPLLEASMHAGIYRSRPEVRAVVHAHARFSTSLACPDWETPPVHYMLAVLPDEGRVPVTRYAAYGTDDAAENAARALGMTTEEMDEASAKIHDYGQSEASGAREGRR